MKPSQPFLVNFETSPGLEVRLGEIIMLGDCLKI
jgi:hypothetical protein